MDNLTSSLKYIIELTEAYKNNFITKSEYKELRVYEILVSSLRISRLKEFHEILLQSAMLSMTFQQMLVILSQPKPRFNLGCAFENGMGRDTGKEELIIGDNKSVFLNTNHESIVKLPTNTKL